MAYKPCIALRLSSSFVFSAKRSLAAVKLNAGWIKKYNKICNTIRTETCVDTVITDAAVATGDYSTYPIPRATCVILSLTIDLC